MRNTRYETLQEHSMEVAVIAHALANIDRVKFNADVDASEVAVAALFVCAFLLYYILRDMFVF